MQELQRYECKREEQVRRPGSLSDGWAALSTCGAGESGRKGK